MPFWSDEEPTGLELGEGLLLVFLSLVILMVGILSVYLATRRGGEDTPDELNVSRRSSRHSRRASVGSRRPRSGSREESPPAQDSSSNESTAGTPLVPSKRRSKRSMNRNRTPQSEGGSARSFGGGNFGINAARRRSAQFGGSVHGSGVGRPSGGSMEMHSAHIVGRSFANDEVKKVERYDTFSISHSLGLNSSRDDISATRRGSESTSEAHCLDRKGGLIYGLNCALNYNNSNSQIIGESRKDEVLDSLINNLMDTRNVSRCLNRRDGLNDGLCNALRDALTDAISDALSDALTDALHDALTGSASPGLSEGMGSVTSDDLCSIMSDIGTCSPTESFTGRKKGQKLSVQLLRRCYENKSEQLRAFKSSLAGSTRDMASKVGSVDTITTRKSSPIRGTRLNNTTSQRDTHNADHNADRQFLAKESNEIQQVESGYLSCRSAQTKEDSDEKLDEFTVDDISDIRPGIIEILKNEVALERDKAAAGAQRVSRTFGRRCNDQTCDNVEDDRKDNRGVGDSTERSTEIKNPPSKRKRPESACKCLSTNMKRRPISAVDQCRYKCPKHNVEQKVCNVGSSFEMNVKSLDENSDTYSTNDESDRNTDQIHPSAEGIPNSRGKQSSVKKKIINSGAGECKKHTVEQSKRPPEKDSCICKSKVRLSGSRGSWQNVDQNFGQRVGGSMDRVGDPRAKSKDIDKEGATRPVTEQALKYRVDFTARAMGEKGESKKHASDVSPAPGGKMCPKKRCLQRTNISPCCNICNRRGRSPMGNKSCKCKI